VADAAARRAIKARDMVGSLEGGVRGRRQESAGRICDRRTNSAMQQKRLGVRTGSPRGEC